MKNNSRTQSFLIIGIVLSLFIGIFIGALIFSKDTGSSTIDILGYGFGLDSENLEVFEYGRLNGEVITEGLQDDDKCKEYFRIKFVDDGNDNLKCRIAAASFIEFGKDSIACACAF